MGNYQATFMRSTKDHIFVVRRILDEKWKAVGLKLNETKTKMLVRDPINKSIDKQTQEINGVLITPVDTIKYVGTYLTSELNRKDTIKARCKQAIRNAKGLIPFIKKTKMRWKIAKLIYKTVISPSMKYGLNVVALTESNRTRLKQYEREILKDMLQAARNRPKLKTQEILEGKTINRIIKAALAKSKVETEKLRMKHSNFQKQILKALHQAKKTKNERQMEETCPFPLCTTAEINFREKEKQILDQILGPGRYDARIRPSGVNGTGELPLHHPLSASSIAIGRLRSSPLGHPFSLVCYCVTVFFRAAFRSVGFRACTSVWGAAQCKSRGGSDKATGDKLRLPCRLHAEPAHGFYAYGALP
ncbi:Glutamate-gated chloride channel [Eumeta japonica]|uniref:Glutamate-gated chloride channel n=1 Tax=Eumeta variegata TaxID=151549 RepID=A0A4C1TDG9_EUMVA|nr:Glutamate-gated chloride channel [Eumeta japonica]